jgi:hypothetical protein
LTRKQIVIVIVAGVALGLLVAAELILPNVAENEVESRLTEGGGTADVSVSSFPSERLLFGNGDSIEVDAEDLDLALVEEADVFEKLDGFDEVDVSVSQSAFGPFDVSSFELTRDGDEPYRLTTESTASLAELGAFGAESMGIPGAEVIGGILGFFEGTGTALPIELDMELESSDGSVEVVSGEGSIAGIPTGPLAELIVGAIVSRL